MRSSGLDLRVYLVTDPGLGRGRPLVDLVAAAVAGGVTCVQLRDKEATDDELRAQAEELHDVLRPLGVPLVINDRVDVARRTQAGVHVGVHDVSPLDARGTLGPEAVIGWSLETPGQLREPAVAACSYVAASPVWTTGTKSDTAAPLGLDGLARLRSLTALPLVAIGGVDRDRAAEAVLAGADGVAVVSAILAADDPQEAARGIRAAVDTALVRRREAG